MGWSITHRNGSNWELIELDNFISEYKARHMMKDPYSEFRNLLMDSDRNLYLLDDSNSVVPFDSDDAILIDSND